MPDSDHDRLTALASELRSVLGQIKRRLREQSLANDLTPSQVSVLLRLEKDGPAAVSTLARAEAMRPQSMSAIVKALEDAGLVEGAADPGDKRQTLISLSRKCRELLSTGRAARQDWFTSTLERKLTVPEQEQLAAAVKLLARLISD